MAPRDDEDLEDDELEDDEDDEDEDDEGDEDDDPDEDDDSDALEQYTKADMLEDIADHLGDVFQEASEVDLNEEGECVDIAMNDGTRWKLTVRKVG